MNRINVLEVTVPFAGAEQTVHPVLMRDEESLVLVDCGYPDSIDTLTGAMRAAGAEPAALTHIVITHHDFDHMGCLGALKRVAPGAAVIASREDADHIDGTKPSLRLRQAENLHGTLPESERPGAERFMQLLGSIDAVPVDLAVNDGHRFDWCGGTTVIATPGHMPGHLSLYVEESKTLIAGDALVVDGDELLIANPHYTLDMNEAMASVEKLLSYDIDTLIAYHGGAFTGNIRTALENIIERSA